jgi:hypothetical protein
VVELELCASSFDIEVSVARNISSRSMLKAKIEKDLMPAAA